MHDIERMCMPDAPQYKVHIEGLNSLLHDGSIGITHSDLVRFGITSDSLRLYIASLDFAPSPGSSTVLTWDSYMTFHEGLSTRFNALVGVFSVARIGTFAGIENIDTRLLDYICVLTTMVQEYDTCFTELRIRNALQITLKTVDVALRLHTHIATLTDSRMREQYNIVLANAVYCIMRMLTPFAPRVAPRLLDMFDLTGVTMPRDQATRFTFTVENVPVRRVSRPLFHTLVQKRNTDPRCIIA